MRHGEPALTSSAKTARLGVVLGSIVAVYVAARVLGLEGYFHAERIRELVEQTGAWGALTFVLLFVGGVAAQVPGLVFVFATPALFPWPEGWLLCFLASNLAVIVNFEIVRKLGGQPLAETERPWLQKLLAGLDENPVRTVALLRTITVMFPPVTGALALTQVSSRDHAIGSALGMVLPITALLAAASWLIG